TVTTESLRLKPRRTWYGAHGLSSSFSPKQNEYFAGDPMVERSMTPGLAPPTFRRISSSARPLGALARQPCPSPLLLHLIGSSCGKGPLTITIGAHGCVVASVPCRL